MSLWLIMIAIGLLQHRAANSELQGQADLSFHEALKAEKVMMDALRSYSGALRQQIDDMKSKTQALSELYANTEELNIEALVGNPLQVLAILNRFVVDWPEFVKVARVAFDIDANVERMLEGLKEIQLPTKTDYEKTMENFLRVQNDDGLESFSEQFGSKLSWSDCLEVGRKSDKNGEYDVAKFWMETALEKLQAATNQTSSNDYLKSKSKILESILNNEYRAGRLKDALNLSQQLLEIYPKSKNIQKAITTIKKKLTKSQGTKPKTKSRGVKKSTQARINRDEHEFCHGSACGNSSGALTALQSCQLTELHGHLTHLISESNRVCSTQRML